MRRANKEWPTMKLEDAQRYREGWLSRPVSRPAPHRWLDMEVGDSILVRAPVAHVIPMRGQIVAEHNWQLAFDLQPQAADDGAEHTIVTRTR